MLNNLKLRPAEEKDLSAIIQLYAEDEFGSTRESLSDPLLPSYWQIFQSISEDKNQALLVAEFQGQVIATCHLTFIPFLSFKGSWRLNLENIHVAQKHQNQGIGTWMVEKALTLGKERGCKVVQLTTNKKRTQAKSFYEKLGFKATHEGMKFEEEEHTQ